MSFIAIKIVKKYLILWIIKYISQKVNVNATSSSILTISEHFSKVHKHNKNMEVLIDKLNICLSKENLVEDGLIIGGESFYDVILFFGWFNLVYIACHRSKPR